MYYIIKKYQKSRKTSDIIIMKPIDLFLMPYSKSRKIDKVLFNLNHAPKQISNALNIFTGVIMEFHLENDDHAGTLLEYHEFFQLNDTGLDANKFNIHLEDGQIYVEIDNDGNFKPVKIFKIN